MKKYNKMPKLEYKYRPDGRVNYCNINFEHEDEKYSMSVVPEDAAVGDMGIMSILKDTLIF